ncbi:MAG TPA: hypothetical protein VIW94_08035 [Acidimicrobiia bacterium]
MFDGSDTGHAGIELALGIGLLMIPVALLVLGFGPWVERSVLAEAAAAEASRAAVIATSVDAGTSVATEMGNNYGLTADHVRVGWCGAPPAQGGNGTCQFDRGSGIMATVEVWVPLVTTPWGTMGGLWLERSHVESVDIYRSFP